MNIGNNNLPRISRDQYPEGREVGYYTSSFCRNHRMFPDGAYINGLWFDKEAEKTKNFKLGWGFEDFYPKKQPVWISCRNKKFKFYSVITNEREFICNKEMLTAIESSRIDGNLMTFDCKLYSGTTEISTPFSYHGIYGAPRGEYNKKIPDTFAPSVEIGFSQALRNPYVFYYINSDLDELNQFDLFVGPQRRLFFSERLVIKMVEVEPMLQFDPVLTMD